MQRKCKYICIFVGARNVSATFACCALKLTL